MERRVHDPLYLTVLRVGAVWLGLSFGYFAVLPLFGIEQSYNESPVALAVYYMAWLGIALFTFRDVLADLSLERRWWVYGVYCLASAGILSLAFFALSNLPVPQGEALVPYTDILFATPWYFLPKAIEILVQQSLIATLVLALSTQIRSITRVALAYAVLFGGTHLVGLWLAGAPTPYATAMTLGAIASALVFPYLILRVRSGFMYAFLVHVLFYGTFVLISHTWPPPDYL